MEGLGNVGNPPKLSKEMQMDFHHAFKEWVRVVMHGKRSLLKKSTRSNVCGP